MTPEIPDLNLATARNIPRAFRYSCRGQDPRREMITDPATGPLTQRKIELGAAALGRVLFRRFARGTTVGLLMPTVASMPVVLLAMWRSGLLPAMMNPTVGPGPAVSALETAGVRQVLSSRAFVERAGLEPLIAALENSGREILWVEDLRKSVTPLDKLAAFTGYRRPGPAEPDRDDPAVVLFTSGTEGQPKGVVLSHGNLLANVAQVLSVTHVQPDDRFLSPLPLFHSLGLMAGLILPLLRGCPTMVYPNPLHYRVIPELARAHRPTVIVGTDTFLTGWGRRGSAEDFTSLRAAISGAEPVRASTRKMWEEGFGTRLLEGYGATEAAPVLALNTPFEACDGTVGKLLPGIVHRLEPVPGTGGGRLLVAGPNIMLGYFLPEAPGRVTPRPDGFYDTGDIVALTDEGFVRILGRAKRFAKIGGEMVSLTAVEDLAHGIWPENRVGAIIRPDPRKGERVVLAVEHGEEAGACRERVLEAARAKGIAEIMVPAEVVCVAEMPVFASGKCNYPALEKQLLSA